MLDATPLLHVWAARREAALRRLDPVQAQQAGLMGLLRTAASTRFGMAHEFAELDSVDAYQRRVPLRRYEAFWQDWWQPAFPRLDGVTWPGRIPFLAESSGTSSGVTKYIPVSPGMLRSNRQAALEVLGLHAAAHPATRVFGGENFLLGGSTALRRLTDGVAAGDLSGIAAATTPWWARRRQYPPQDIALLGDWKRKIDLLVRQSPGRDLRSISGTPSWLLLYFERLAALRPELPPRLAAHFPNLELLVHGGVGFAPYRDRFARWLEGSRAATREVYPASEGFIAIADRGDGEGLRLILDRGLFYEFVPLDRLDEAAPPRHWIATAQTGVEYALVLTSNAGLWSYVLGDTVRLIDLSPPRLLVTGRISYALSVAGEHLTAHELDTAMLAAARRVGADVTDYVAAAVHPDAADARVGHRFFVETAEPCADAAGFAAALDAALAAGNADYAVHRQGNFGMRPPEVRLLAPGSFARWMLSRRKLGGQNKVPRVVADPGMLEQLERLV
jgi:hypothetical protein